MVLKATNVVGLWVLSNPITLHWIWRILMVRRIDDLVLGTPGNRWCLWPSTSKQGSGVGHTLNESFIYLTRLGMVLKATNVVGLWVLSNPITLHWIWRILMVRRIDDLVLGTPGNRWCLWPSTSKQAYLKWILYVFGPWQVNNRASYLKATLALGWPLLKHPPPGWWGDHRIIIMMSDEGVCYRICQVCTPSLIWGFCGL
jgi:hypothetical protein